MSRLIKKKNRSRMRVNSKKGSSAVFLTVILAALISVTLALVYGVREAAVRSASDAVLSLAGDSVLSEFDRRLQREYGLFLIKGTDKALTGKFYDYIGYSLDGSENVRLNSLRVSAGKFSVADPAVIREQITEHMKVAQTGDEAGQQNNMESRELRHGPTIASLPSAGMPKKGLTASAEALAGKASSVSEAFKSGTDDYLINRYVFSRFNSKVNAINDKHFFSREVEYILGGEMSDRKNEKRVELALKAMRFPVNLAYLYSDPEKQAALAAAAQIMTPGPAAAATQAALASTWAYAESDNDVELLWQGRKIPMIKDDSTWAVELNDAIEGIFGGTVQPAVEKGYDYNEYLQILLFFQDDNVKLSRILDLIQINMRAEYDRDFLIGEYAAGINVQVRINGKMYEYDKRY